VEREELAARIYRASHLRGEFTLRSGQHATEYFDKYRFEADPAVLRAIAEALAPLVPDDTQALAGLELGGVPIAALLSQVTGLPALFVRKQAKTYGTCQLAEGGEVSGRRLLIVEDVISTGGQVAISTNQLRELGASVDQAICVIDRSGGEAAPLLEAGVRHRALYTPAELEAAAKKHPN